MANYETLKSAVQSVVKTNGNQEITGANMQTTLLSMINSLGTGYQFIGIATPSTNTGTPDQNVFYIGGAGTYANFGSSVTVPAGSICIFKYNGSWTKEQIAVNENLSLEDKTLGRIYDFEELSTTILTSNFLNTSGVVQYISSADYIIRYAYIQKGKVVKVKTSVESWSGGVGIFSEVPESNSVAVTHWVYNGAFIMPMDGYLTVTSNGQLGCSIHIASEQNDEVLGLGGRTNALENQASKLNELYETIEATPRLNGYINSDGVFTSGQWWRTTYAFVNKGDEIVATKYVVGGNWRCGFTVKEPSVNGFVLDKIITDFPTMSPGTKQDKGVYIAPYSGYFSISSASDELSSFGMIVRRAAPVLWSKRLEPDGTILRYYINASGQFISLDSHITRYWTVKKGEKLLTDKRASVYANFAFFSNIPTSSSTPDSYIADGSTEAISPINGYVAISAGTNQWEWGITPSLQKALQYSNTLQLLVSRKSDYIGKTCLYIGDSISTRDNYQWKGFLEQNYNITWARDIYQALAPANGGIPLIPPVTEPDSLAEKSIWYRCAQNRMSVYNFDMISVLGGWNDMAGTEENLTIGTISDIPFVDNASSITSETVTDVRPEILTYASALMGCVLMLKRDFPTKEIVIPTVYPNWYGRWTDPVTNYMASLAVARIQVAVAQKYGLKSIPLYWGVITNQTYDVFTRDGVHPNLQGALFIQSVFAKTLGL